MNTETYLAKREKKVTKANELIQKSRFSLSKQQQRIVLYLISQIEQHDKDFKLYTFDIIEFCKICGIELGGGKTYNELKEALKEISDKSLWITLPDERETLVRWIEKPYIEPKRGTISIKLDADMKPYLLQLKQNFTSYELIYTLHFKSQYSIRLYELVRSIHYHEMDILTITYSVDELRKRMGAENKSSKVYSNFKNRALLPAIEEINAYSDKIISFKEDKRGHGKAITHIIFTIRTKEPIERLKVRAKIDQEMGTDGQMTLWERAVDR